MSVIANFRRRGKADRGQRTDITNDLLRQLLAALQIHSQSTPAHHTAIGNINAALGSFQRDGQITEYELGTITPDTIHVLGFMPIEAWTGDNRSRIRARMRAVGNAVGLVIDIHLMPDGSDGVEG